MAAEHDFPLTAHSSLTVDEQHRLQELLLGEHQKEGSETTEFLLGHHTFFYGAPNALARVLLPLFKRVEDFTAYDPDTLIGLPARIINYNIENPDPITYLG